jgi:hypothetical protein
MNTIGHRSLDLNRTLWGSVNDVVRPVVDLNSVNNNGTPWRIMV